MIHGPNIPGSYAIIVLYTIGLYFHHQTHSQLGTVSTLAEAEDIKKRWQEYTGELYKTDLHVPDNHDGVISHTTLECEEPDILECEVKWALGSTTTNKASGGDGISVELFQILKDDALKVLHTICQ